MELCALFCTEARGLSLCQPLWMRGGGLSFLTYIIRESNILISAGLSNSDFCFHWQSKELSSVLSKFCVVGIAWNDCLKLTFYSALPSASDISSVDLSDPCPSNSRLPETACPSGDHNSCDSNSDWKIYQEKEKHFQLMWEIRKKNHEFMLISWGYHT